MSRSFQVQDRVNIRAAGELAIRSRQATVLYSSTDTLVVEVEKTREKRYYSRRNGGHWQRSCDQGKTLITRRRA